jgi:hypothetical protein
MLGFRNLNFMCEYDHQDILRRALDEFHAKHCLVASMHCDLRFVQ